MKKINNNQVVAIKILIGLFIVAGAITILKCGYQAGQWLQLVTHR